MIANYSGYWPTIEMKEKLTLFSTGNTLHLTFSSDDNHYLYGYGFLAFAYGVKKTGKIIYLNCMYFFLA